MDPKYYGLIEMTLSFGVVLALGLWELRSLAKAKRRRRENAPSPPRHPER